MGTLEQVSNMRNQGMSNQDIMNDLSEKGISPREINDALNQSQIKSAVSTIQGNDYNEDESMGGNYSPRAQEFEGQQNSQDYAPQPSTTQYPQQTYADQNVYTPSPQQNQFQNYDQTYAPQDYSQTQSYDSYANYDTNSIMEIAEQIIDDKMDETNNKISELKEFRTLVQSHVEQIENRLERIEMIIDKLQISILDKVGSYGDNLNSIKKEMEMMQDSFTKVINPLTDKISKK